MVPRGWLSGRECRDSRWFAERQLSAGGRNLARCLGVAVRDGGDLFLLFPICGGPKGDGYVKFSRDYVPGWKPRSSDHALRFRRAAAARFVWRRCV